MCRRDQPVFITQDGGSRHPFHSEVPSDRTTIKVHDTADQREGITKNNKNNKLCMRPKFEDEHVRERSGKSFHPSVIAHERTHIRCFFHSFRS